MQGHKLEFSKDGLNEIAGLAIKRKTGARGLRGIVERFMLDAQFELPGIKTPRLYRVDAEVVKGEKELLKSYKALKKPPDKKPPDKKPPEKKEGAAA